jgi:drug/metabolite transporter (DMT)-like permease
LLATLPGVRWGTNNAEIEAANNVAQPEQPLTEKPVTRGRAFAAMVVANILLAFGPLLVRMADVSPIGSGFWRLALAAPMLLILCRVAGQPIPRMPRGILIALLVGGCFFAADLATWHSGIIRTKLANATLFGNIATFTFSAYGLILARRLPNRGQTGALILAGIGTALLLGRSYELSARFLHGDLLCIAAGLLYTGYLINVGRARNILQPLPALAIVTLAGVLPMLLLALAMGETVWPHNWWPLILLALGSQVIGQGLLVYAVGLLPPIVVGLGFLIQPLVAAIIGILIYAERLAPADIAGAIAIAAALILVRKADSPPLAKPAATA